MTDPRTAHRECQELLPWYVSGTLADGERRRLEQHLGECLPCNAALRDERRLSALLRDQDAVPLGPEHGLAALLDRIDGAQRPRRSAARVAPWVRYGLAAGFGGGIVWLWLALAPPAPLVDGTFATLTTAGESGPGRVDIVFAAAPSAAELTAFLREQGAELVAGPSALGRYTIALEAPSEEALAARIDALGKDSRLRFAGRSYAEVGDGGKPTDPAGEDRR